MRRNIVLYFLIGMWNIKLKNLTNKNLETIQKFGTEAERVWRELRHWALDRFMKEQKNNHQQ